MIATPKGWRHLVVDGLDYLWHVSLGRTHDDETVRLTVRHAEQADGAAAAVRWRGHGAILRITTGIPSPHACNGPQCRQYPAITALEPRQVTAAVREAADTHGWTAAAPCALHLDLSDAGAWVLRPVA